MSNKIIDVRKVAKIKQLIERQVQLRVEQLATLVQLKKSIEQRMFRGQLLEDDIKMIGDKLAEMPARLIEPRPTTPPSKPFSICSTARSGTATR